MLNSNNCMLGEPFQVMIHLVFEVHCSREASHRVDLCKLKRRKFILLDCGQNIPHVRPKPVKSAQTLADHLTRAPPSSVLRLCTCHRLAPGVGPRANQGNMSGNTRGWIDFSAPGQGKIRDIVLSSKERGGGIRNFVKSQTPTTEISGGFAAFPNP